MKSLNIEKRILLLNTETKEKINIYTYVDLNSNETGTIAGVKAKLPLHKPLKITISLRFNKQMLELKTGEKKFINETNMFITSLEEIKNGN